MAYDYSRYLRNDKFPHIWCPGCTYGIVLKAIIRAIDKAGLKQDDTAIVSGIGCASRLPGYVDFNTLHTTHGRAIAFATGIKMVKPDKNVLVITGDGDATAIGGNHFIHACRRNIDITVVVFNNYIYGMTGGQYSPTTPTGAVATTMPYGNVDPQFNILELAKGAGATFIARGTAYHAAGIDNLVVEAIKHKGLSVVEIINACPTTYGRRNKFKSPTDMLLWMKDHFLPVTAFEKLPPEKTAGKLPMGILYREEKPEYTEMYYSMVKRVQEGGK
ncbi:MAG: 2-oxoacid:ferredoxin oxidoreductase subunit beta [Deltaproteobacteria bacterium]|nr:MAG: 2-oxoacid:ferredoxin oxidoreductase subunit beta [Deltaproteobacteria bacterium]